MQIAYFGFAGSAALEAEAAAELVRLERFAKRIAGCHLAIVAMHDRPGHRLYDARLDLITRESHLVPVHRSTDENANAAVRLAFDNAVAVLEKEIEKS